MECAKGAQMQSPCHHAVDAATALHCVMMMEHFKATALACYAAVGVICEMLWKWRRYQRQPMRQQRRHVSGSNLNVIVRILTTVSSSRWRWVIARRTAEHLRREMNSGDTVALRNSKYTHRPQSLSDSLGAADPCRSRRAPVIPPESGSAASDGARMRTRIRRCIDDS